MQLHTKISGEELLLSVATVGFFNGVHREHRFLIEQICGAAAVRGFASSVVTFPVHLCKVMHLDFRSGLLTTCDEETTLLADTGIDYCIMLDFTPDLARPSAKQFMAILKGDCQVQTLVIGCDHRFEHNRSGDFDDYVRYRQELGMGMILTQAYSNNEMTVSSSAIRHLLLEGNVSGAANCLGYHFFLNGAVVNSYHVGRKIGFPATNLCISDSEELVPTNGVYAVNVFLGEAKHIGMLSIGYRPTLNNGLDRSIEMHIFYFDANICDQPMRISFIRRARPELKFGSIGRLIEQLRKDEAEITAILSLQQYSLLFHFLGHSLHVY